MTSEPLPWEEVEHTADWALVIRGRTLGDLFANAARGMASLAGGVPNIDLPLDRYRVELDALDWETLLIDWLTELLYLIEDDHFVLEDVAVQQIEPYRLRAEAAGRPGEGFTKHIKAATYHNLAIEEMDDGYETTVVFDV
jgi:SHS2 domain-containing protein